MQHSAVRYDGSILREYDSLHALERRNSVVRITHELVHFTYPDPDLIDEHDRDVYVTLHRFVVEETDESLPAEVAECPQFSRSRDRAPPWDTWPQAVRAFRARAVRRGVQVRERHFLCDADDYDLEMRYEVPGRLRRQY